jgi:hypothetical protein
MTKNLFVELGVYIALCDTRNGNLPVQRGCSVKLCAADSLILRYNETAMLRSTNFVTFGRPNAPVV